MGSVALLSHLNGLVIRCYFRVVVCDVSGKPRVLCEKGILLDFIVPWGRNRRSGMKLEIYVAAEGVNCY
jgi:hypothetical protein